MNKGSALTFDRQNEAPQKVNLSRPTRSTQIRPRTDRRQTSELQSHMLTDISTCHENGEFIQQHIQMIGDGSDIPHRTNIVTINFTAFGRQFNLGLKPCQDRNVSIDMLYSGRIIIQSNEISNKYCGQEITEPSQVHGSLFHGIFTGAIHTKLEDYYIEWCPMKHLNKTNYLASIYRWSDLIARERNESVFYRLFKKESICSKVSPVNSLNQRHGPRQRFRRTATEGLTCSLHLYVDHTFFQDVGNGDKEVTLAKVFFYIMEADRIFQESDFDGDGGRDAVGFNIGRVTVMTDEESTRDYGLLPEETNATVLLNTFSKTDHSDACLALLFTSRNLQERVMGLAWLASSSYYDYAGGICQEPVYFEEEYFSFNTLLVSAKLHDEVLPDAVTSLTTAHELGHAFGSPHDEETDSDCSPGPPDGHYIMHPFATEASLPNNHLFSECSMAYINPVMESKGFCMEPGQAARCGDRFVQGDEECDCGLPDECPFFDPCCIPLSDELEGCRLRPGVACSPAVSPCCSATCSVVEAYEEKVCHPTVDCQLPTFCNGQHPQCPAPEPAPDWTLCRMGAALCVDGFCTLSRCSALNLTECQCLYPPAARCQLCCYQGTTRQCLPIISLGISGSNGAPIYHLPGKSCMQSTGFCTQNHRCIHPNQDDTAERLHSFFSNTTLHSVRLWFKERWGLVLSLIFIVGGILVALFTCVYQGRKAPVRSLALATARMAVLWQQVEFEQQHLKDRLDKLYWEWNLERNKAREVKAVDCCTLVARLSLFFPTVSRTKIVEVALSSPSEAAAVRRLILEGYPLRKLLTDGKVLSESASCQ